MFHDLTFHSTRFYSTDFNRYAGKNSVAAYIIDNVLISIELCQLIEFTYLFCYIT